MRKIFALSFVLLLVMCGCNKTNDTLILETEGIREIRISEYASILTRITDQKKIEEITDALQKAEIIMGALDIAGWDYGIMIIYESSATKGFYLCLGETDGTLIDAGNTEQGYNLYKDSVDVLKKYMIRQP